MRTDYTPLIPMSTLKKRQRSAPDTKKYVNLLSFKASEEEIMLYQKAMSKLKLTRGELIRKSLSSYIEKAL